MDIDDTTSKQLDFDQCLDTPSKKRRQNQSSIPTNLEVFLRIRPRDKLKSSTSHHQITNQNKSIQLSAPNKTDTRNYSFNYIFDETATNKQVFNKIGSKAIDRFLNGYTNLIFTYGITGSGKTYTITGNEFDGLMPSILHGIFTHDKIANDKDGKYEIYASYLENYTKDVFDLLSHENTNNLFNDKENYNPYNNNFNQNKGGKVTVRVVSSSRVELENLTTIQLKDASHALQLIQSGNTKRSKAHTKLNTNSSRSHALFILDLFEGNTIKSRLCIVDLAGSESVKRAGFGMNHARFQESCEINTSLSVLGRCLESIQNKSGNALAAPWREVILTKILWEYLHGKGYVTMIVTAHICDDDYNETMRALEFAANSQNIQMNPVVNSVRPSTRHKSRIHKTPRNRDKYKGGTGSISNESSRESSVDSKHGAGLRDISMEISVLNTCTMDQLRKIAIESYKTSVYCYDKLQNMKQEKIRLIEKVMQKGLSKDVIHQVIHEESMDMDIDGDDDDDDLEQEMEKKMKSKDDEWEKKMNEMKDEYEHRLKNVKGEFDDLSRKMAQNAVDFEEKRAELNHLYAIKKKMENEVNEMKKKHDAEMMAQMFKFQDKENKHKEDLEKLNKDTNFKITDLEEELKSKCMKYTELEGKMDEYEATKISLQSDLNAMSRRIEQYELEETKRKEQELQMEGKERNKQIEYEQKELKLNQEIQGLMEKNKQLLIEKNKLETTTIRYKASIDESEQKNEKLAHSNRDFKGKLQKQHIKNTELKEREKKLNDMMEKMKIELNEHCQQFEKEKDALNKEINTKQQINEDAQKEIVALNKRLMTKENELKVKIEKEIEKYAECKQQFDGLKKEFIQRGEELKNLKTQLNANMQQSENQKLVYEKRITELNKSIESTQHSLGEITRKLSDKQSEFDENIKKLNEEKEQMLDDHASNTLSLQSQISEKQQQIEQINNKFNQALNEKDELTQKLKAASIWSDKYQKLLTNYQNHCQQFEKLKAKHHGQCATLSTYKQEIQQINDNKDRLCEEMKTLQSEYAQNVKQINQTFTKQSNKISKLESEKEGFISKLEAMKSKYLQHQELNNKLLQTKEDRFENLQNKHAETDKAYKELNEQFKSLKSQHLELIEKANKNESLLIEYQNELEKYNESISEKQNALEALTKELHDEQQQHQQDIEAKEEQHRLEIQSKNERHRLELADADQEYLKADKECKELYVENEKLEKRTKALQDHNQKLSTLFQQSQDQMTKLNQEKTTLFSELSALKQRHSEEISALKAKHLEAIKSAAQTEKDKVENQWRSKITQKEMEKDSLQKQIQALESQVQTLKLQCSQPPSKRQSTASDKANNTNDTNDNHNIKPLQKRKRSNSSTRKRTRTQMEDEEIDTDKSTPSNPAKKRKVTIDGNNIGIPTNDDTALQDEVPSPNIPPFQDDDDDEDMMFDQLNAINISNTNISKSDSSSLQPQNLLNEYNDDQPMQDKQEKEEEQKEEEVNVTKKSDKEENDDDDDDDSRDAEMTQHDEVKDTQQTEQVLKVKIPETPVIINESSKKGLKSTTKQNLVSPAPSHLSEGDDPLPKPPTSRVRKAIQKANKPKRTYKDRGKRVRQQHRAMRTPATKNTKRRITSFDPSKPTPRTKSGLQQLRCVDLKKKLKKHNLRQKAKKDDMIAALYQHFQAEEEKEKQLEIQQKNDENHNYQQDMKRTNDEREESQESSDIFDSEMVGRCIKEENGNKYYKSIKIDGVLYNVGDEVYVAADSETSVIWLGSIASLFEDEEGDRFMGNFWYWKYPEIKKAVKKKPYHTWKSGEYEVFITHGHEPDINHISLVRHKKKFKVFRNQKEMDTFNQNHQHKMETFFCQYAFNMKEKKLIEREPMDTINNIKIEPIAEGNEEEENENEIEIEIENIKEEKKPRRKRKRKTTTAISRGEVITDDNNGNSNNKEVKNEVNNKKKGKRKVRRGRKSVK